ncbi:MAG: class I SAM-dependent methyltransferase [Actinobacteria bacterium]|nr:MAG: class I SAM-dependent methyltransferase [Actinomycetota bacterium]
MRRAVETGTFGGDGTRVLAAAFPTVLTIELSPELHERAKAKLADLDGVAVLCGNSTELLSKVVDAQVPTLYYLDGHWSGEGTAGAEQQCPVMDELELIAAGHPDDCVLIDDARLFCSAPPPPYDPRQWPTLVQVFDALRAARPGCHVTVLDDQVIATPRAAKPVVDRYGQELAARQEAEAIARQRPPLIYRALDRVRARLPGGLAGTSSPQ